MADVSETRSFSVGASDIIFPILIASGFPVGGIAAKLLSRFAAYQKAVTLASLGACVLPFAAFAAWRFQANKYLRRKDLLQKEIDEIGAKASDAYQKYRRKEEIVLATCDAQHAALNQTHNRSEREKLERDIEDILRDERENGSVEFDQWLSEELQRLDKFTDYLGICQADLSNDKTWFQGIMMVCISLSLGFFITGIAGEPLFSTIYTQQAASFLAYCKRVWA